MNRREFCTCTLLAAGLAVMGGSPLALAQGDKDKFQLKFELSRAGQDRLETLFLAVDEGAKGRLAIPGTLNTFVEVTLVREKAGPVDFIFLLISPDAPDAKPEKQVLKRGSPPPDFHFKVAGQAMALRLVSLKASLASGGAATGKKKCKKCRGSKVCQACGGAKKNVCGNCGGAGETDRGVCSACGGRGIISVCGVCSGSGRCYYCGGSGLAP